MSDHRGGYAPGHVFLSYVHEDRHRVDRLQIMLEDAGIKVWRDTGRLWPGQDWKVEIRRAILSGSLAFIACFSKHSELRDFSYQIEELILAADQMRRLPPGRSWIIPVRFTPCTLPDFDLGAGRRLDSLQRIDLFDGSWEPAIPRLLGAIVNILQAPLSTISSGPEIWSTSAASVDAPVLSVQPHFLDLGDLQYGTACRAFIWVNNRGDHDLEWDFELSGDTIEACRHDGGIQLNIPQRPGSIRTSIIIRSNGGKQAISVSGTRESQSATDSGIQAARIIELTSSEADPYIPEDHARTKLRAWLKKNPDVPSDLFEGTLVMRNASSAWLTVTQVKEFRSENRVESPREPADTYEDLQLVRSPLTWSDQEWRGALANSSETITCRLCSATGTIRCRECNGTGGRMCPPIVACGTCHGSGARLTGKDSAPCYKCHGTKTTECSRCGGSGQISCARCEGHGNNVCSRCAGFTEVIQYTEGSVYRSTASGSISTNLYPEAKVARRIAGYRSLQVPISEELLAFSPSSFRPFLADEMNASWTPDELARIATVEILQASAVTYNYGPHEGAAYFVGSNHAIYIELSKQERRRLRIISHGGRLNALKSSARNFLEPVRSSVKMVADSLSSRRPKRGKVI